MPGILRSDPHEEQREPGINDGSHLPRRGSNGDGTRDPLFDLAVRRSHAARGAGSPEFSFRQKNVEQKLVTTLQATNM